MTLEEAKKLKKGEYIYHITALDRSNNPLRVRVSGKVKTWKFDTFRVDVPVKGGLHFYARLTEADLSSWDTIPPVPTVLTDLSGRKWRFTLTSNPMGILCGRLRRTV